MVQRDSIVLWALLATLALCACKAVDASVPSAGVPVAPSPQKRAQLDPSTQWGAWRGPLGTGHSTTARPPHVWAPDKSIGWRLPIAGLGHSSPVVWNGVIYLTTAVTFGPELDRLVPERPGAHHNRAPDRAMRFEALAISLVDGDVRWRRTLRSEQPHEGAHETASWASASCVTDGEVVIVPFGSRGLFALSPDGEVLWERDLGDMHTKHGHGEGSSPALAHGLVVAQWDHEDASFLVALDRDTGQERWRMARDEVTSWASPIVVDVGGTLQVVTAATGRVRGQDLRSGAIIWEAGGLSHNVVASPVAADGRVFVASSYEVRSMFAVSMGGAQGDVTNTDHVLWRRTRDTPYVASPSLSPGGLCFVRHLSSVLTCVDPATGAATIGPKKRRGLRRVFSSPVSGAGRLYVTSQEGATAVLDLKNELAVLAVNSIGEVVTASPALVGDALVLRSEDALYAIREERAP